jgi:hypothetical protein
LPRAAKDRPGRKDEEVHRDEPARSPDKATVRDREDAGQDGQLDWMIRQQVAE